MLKLKYVYFYLLCSILCTTMCFCFMQRNYSCFLQMLLFV